MEEAHGSKGPKGAKSRGLYGQRPSKSYDEVRRRQFDRIALLSPLERMIEALELGDEATEILAKPRREGPPPS